MASGTRTGALAQGVLAGLLFGTAAIFIRLLPTLDPLSIATLRVALAALALMAILAALGIKPRLLAPGTDAGRLALLGALSGLHFFLFVSAVQHTTVLSATVLVGTSPLMAMGLSTAVFRVRARRSAVIGLTLAFVGSATLLSGDAVEGFQLGLRGDLEAVLAALSEALYLNLGRPIRARMNLLALMLPIFFFAFIVLSVTGLALQSPLSVPTDWRALLALLGLGLIPTALGHSLYFSSLSRLQSYETAGLALLEPVGAALLAAAIFGEVPAPLAVAGGALILVGLYVVLRQSRHTTAPV